MMTMQQTVTIPADRRLHFDLTLPDDVPCGQTEIILTFLNPEQGDETDYLLSVPANRRHLLQAIDDIETG